MKAIPVILSTIALFAAVLAGAAFNLGFTAGSGFGIFTCVVVALFTGLVGLTIGRPVQAFLVVGLFVGIIWFCSHAHISFG